MDNEPNDSPEMVLEGIDTGPAEDGYRPVTLRTSRGDVECRYYEVPGTHRAALWVGGAGGGWDTPARGLYPGLCDQLQQDGIASLRVRFRHSTVLEEAVLDVLAGLTFLESEGIETFALIGHSFGGAVVIQAGAAAEAVRTVITLAAQSYGATAVADLAPDCSILLLHGKADAVLPFASSRYVYQQAHEPKRLVLYDGAQHGFDEVAEQVYRTVYEWIRNSIR